MSIRGKLSLITVSAFIVIYSIVGGMIPKSTNPYVRAIADPGPYPQIRVFEEVVRYIVNDYVERPNLEKVRVGALRGLAEGLDPYSAYLLPEQVREYKANREKGDTTGLVIGQYSGFAYVIAVTPQSPAEKAGLRVGDVIEYINGQATRDLGLYDVKTLLQGTVGTPIELSLINRKTAKLKLVPGSLRETPIESKLREDQIGYLKVPILAAGEAKRVETSLRDLVQKGARAVVLDLRGSAGGAASEGVSVANLFVAEGPLARLLGRKDQDVSVFAAVPEKRVTALPLVAIVDRTTAGASEIVAGAILHHQRGDVVGERTVFGMGVEQDLFPLEDGSALLLTTARYAAPSGKIFTVDGVTPNVEVKRTDLAEVAPGSPEGQEAAPAEEPSAPPVVVAPKSSDDTMLKKALEILQAKIRKN